jgi:hypothetical protein
MTFVRNHAKDIVACDFFVAATATFRLAYVFIIMEVGSRRIVHFNVTQHPSAEWTLQQLRESVPPEKSRLNSSFMTATASIPKTWTPPLRRWV